MDVENNFRAAVDDTRRWAAIMGTIPFCFWLKKKKVCWKKWFPARSSITTTSLLVSMRFASLLATAVVVSY